MATTTETTTSSKIGAENADIGMEDEYGHMDDSGQTFSAGDFKLESGEVLKGVKIRYATFGRLNSAKDNIIVVCHALTGNASVESWWGEMMGPGKPFDTSRFLIVCANVLGSCYGSTGPHSVNPTTGKE